MYFIYTYEKKRNVYLYNTPATFCGVPLQELIFDQLVDLLIAFHLGSRYHNWYSGYDAAWTTDESYFYTERCCPLGYKVLSAGKQLTTFQRLNISLKHR